MEPLIGALLGSFSYRVRGGGLDPLIGRLLKKPAGWELSNIYGRSFWALFVTLSLPLGWHSIFIFALAYLGVLIGYLHQISKFFNFPSGIDLATKENQTWKNYTLLSVRGMFIMLPLALTYGSLYFQLWLAVAGGLLFVPCYLAHNHLKKYVHQNWGELLLGAILGGCLWIQ